MQTKFQLKPNFDSSWNLPSFPFTYKYSLKKCFKCKGRQREQVKEKQREKGRMFDRWILQCLINAEERWEPVSPVWQWRLACVQRQTDLRTADACRHMTERENTGWSAGNCFSWSLYSCLQTGCIDTHVQRPRNTLDWTAVPCSRTCCWLLFLVTS